MSNHLGVRQRSVMVYLADGLPRSLKDIADHISFIRANTYHLLHTLRVKGYIRKLKVNRFQITKSGLDSVSMIGRSLIRNQRGG